MADESPLEAPTRSKSVRRNIVVVGASWGGVDALRQLVSKLPSDLPAAVFVVLHVAPDATSMMPALLSRAGPLPALHPADGEEFRPATIYVAPPDRHLLVETGRVRVSAGPRENRFRPAIDTLFRSAAACYGPRVAGVILTGAQDDGTAGLAYVKAHGGATLVQDPSEAFCPDMPRSALTHVRVDYCLPLNALSSTLVALATAPAAAGSPEHPREGVPMPEQGPEDGFEVSQFTCPDCHGTLWVRDGDVVEFQCRIGHRYSAESMVDSLGDSVERAQWAAVRALEEKAELYHRLALRLRSADGVKAKFENTARDAERQARVLRDLLSEPRR
ncbi:MAG TPA: chemotaxis protein CheB [Candidatus Binatia bacterium]